MASEGPNSPGTMADDNAVGDHPWTDVDKAKVSDDDYAYAPDIVTNDKTEYLKATNFGFSIPVGATIDGIVVEIERFEASTGRDVTDDGVKIVKSDGSIGAEDKSLVPTWAVGDPQSYVSYGDVDDLWSEDWEYTDINNSNFGVVLSAIGGGGVVQGQASVDHIRITVYYTGSINETVTPSTQTLTLTQPTPNLAYDYNFDVAAQALTLTQQTPTITWDSSVSPAVQALVLTLQEPTLSIGPIISPSAFALSLTLPEPTTTLSSSVSPIALALALTLPAPTIDSSTTFEPSTLELITSLNSPTVSGTALVTPSAQALTLLQKTPTVSGTANISPTTLSLLSSLKDPTIKYGGSVSPSTLELVLILKDPTAGSSSNATFLADTLELNLKLLKAIGEETGGYQPLHTSWGHNDFSASAKPQGISLFWKSYIADEDHYEPHLSEYSGLSTNLAEIAERVVPARGQTGKNPNDPLVPKMPHIKRNKDNQLEKFLEGKTLHNKTLFRRIGRKGVKFGEGIDSDTGLLHKWKESQETKS